MTNYTIHFYGVQFSNGNNAHTVDEVVEPISAQEYRDLVEGNGDTFYGAFCMIRARVEERFGLAIEYVADWDAMTEHE